jgi:hypothetical protein
MTWETSDSARFREYHQKTGGRLLSYLSSLIPLTGGKTIEEVALEAKYKEGAEFIIRQMNDILNDREIQDDAANASFATM